MKKILFNSKSKQKGIALLFALAMLSLLLIMAIGFATSAIFEQKAAANSASTTNARVFAQSAMNRVVALLNVYGDSIQYSHDPTNTTDMLSHLTTAVSGAPLYTWQKTDPVSWEYLSVSDGIDTRMIGRFSYKIVPLGGIDPGAIVSQTVDEKLGTEPRIGNNVTEINVTSVSPNDIPVSSALAQNFNYTTFAGAPGKYPGYPPGWQTYDNLFNTLNITASDVRGKFLKWFVLDTLKLNEAFQVNAPSPTPPLYHRFNLTRNFTTDFPAAYPPVAIYEKILLDKNPTASPDGVPDQPPKAYPSTAPEDGYGIPWLAFFGYDKNGVLDNTQKGTFASVIDRRRQIAANLVDYCQVSGSPVTNVNYSTWTTAGADPAFTGNMQTPYINELGFTISVSAKRTSKTNVQISFTPNVLYEVINIYPVADTTPYIRVLYTLNYKINGTAYPPVSILSTNTQMTAAYWNAANTPRYADRAFADPAITCNVTVAKNVAATINITDCQLSIDKVVLSTTSLASGNADCALIKGTSSKWATTVTCAAATNSTWPGTAEFSIAFQTNDPRQNLNPGDWCMTETSPGGTFPASAPYANVGTPGSKNNFNGSPVNPSTTGLDPEVVTDPAYNPGAPAGKTNLSTAYIRHAIMQSPWELGLIHRGAAWETINLKACDLDKANTYVAAGVPVASYAYVRIPGGADYASGDANILDQVKMDNNTTNYKVNINAATDPVTNQNAVLQALLRNIRIGTTYALPGAAVGTAITDPAKLTALFTAIAAKTANYPTRAAVANVAALFDGTCGTVQGTDALKEELIGKFINLTDISGKSQYFYVILLAQAIKDIGTPASAATGLTIIKKDTAGNPVTFNNVRMGAFQKPVESPAGSGNYVYADEVIGEQKIKVLIFMEPSNKCKILSYEFIP